MWVQGWRGGCADRGVSAQVAAAAITGQFGGFGELVCLSALSWRRRPVGFARALGFLPHQPPSPVWALESLCSAASCPTEAAKTHQRSGSQAEGTCAVRAVAWSPLLCWREERRPLARLSALPLLPLYTSLQEAGAQNHRWPGDQPVHEGAQVSALVCSGLVVHEPPVPPLMGLLHQPTNQPASQPSSYNGVERRRGKTCMSA